MALSFLNIGFGNMLPAEKIVCVVKAESSPVKRLIEAAERQNRLVDATNGRRTRSVLVTDSNHVVLSHLTTSSISHKLGSLSMNIAAEDALPNVAGDGE